MTLKQEVYQSSTGKVVSLSFTGRQLLQNLREAIVFALTKGDYHADDNAVSKTRCKLAAYMSRLEVEIDMERNFLKPDLSKACVNDLLAELSRRFYKNETAVTNTNKADPSTYSEAQAAQPNTRCTYQLGGDRCTLHYGHYDAHYFT